jgi:erythromycin esterase-like protein
MIGEASHGTEEFYHHRAEITKQLIERAGFNCIACEADWPDAYRVNRYVQCGKTSRDADANAALGDFKRFPMWMWRNTVVADFVEWLRAYNDHHIRLDAPGGRVAFYGLDLYSFYTSMDAVVEYLEKVSPEDAKRARLRYSLFDRFQGEPSSYGVAAALRLSPSFKKEVVQTLNDLRLKGEEYLQGRGGLIDGDELFYATQNAALVARAEEYYRNMVSADEQTWNIRDEHMADCVASLMAFQRRKSGKACKIVIWAHNSHIGDARATASRRQRGEWNIGQLLRQRLGQDKVFNIGFGTYSGSVTAASEWDAPAEFKQVRNGLAQSHEHLFHAAGEQMREPDFLLVMRSLARASDQRASSAVDLDLLSALNGARLERFIGVIYRPDTEKPSHYTQTKITEEYDALIFIDLTNALEPLDTTMPWLEERSAWQADTKDAFPELDGTLEANQFVEWRLGAAGAINAAGNTALQAGNVAKAVEKYEKAERYLSVAVRPGDEQTLLRLKAAVAVNRAHALLSGGSLAAVDALQRAVGLVQGSGDDLLKHQLAALQAQLPKPLPERRGVAVAQSTHPTQPDQPVRPLSFRFPSESQPSSPATSSA